MKTQLQYETSITNHLARLVCLARCLPRKGRVREVVRVRVVLVQDDARLVDEEGLRLVHQPQSTHELAVEPEGMEVLRVAVRAPHL